MKRESRVSLSTLLLTLSVCSFLLSIDVNAKRHSAGLKEFPSYVAAAEECRRDAKTTEGLERLIRFNHTSASVETLYYRGGCLTEKIKRSGAVQGNYLKLSQISNMLHLHNESLLAIMREVDLAPIKDRQSEEIVDIAEMFLRNSRPKDAAVMLQPLLSNNASGRAYVLAVNSMFEIGDFLSCIATGAQCSEAYPKASLCSYYVGMAARHMGNFSLAAESFNKASLNMGEDEAHVAKLLAATALLAEGPSSFKNVTDMLRQVQGRPTGFFWGVSALAEQTYLNSSLAFPVALKGLKTKDKPSNIAAHIAVSTYSTTGCRRIPRLEAALEKSNISHWYNAHSSPFALCTSFHKDAYLLHRMQRYHGFCTLESVAEHAGLWNTSKLEVKMEWMWHEAETARFVFSPDQRLMMMKDFNEAMKELVVTYLKSLRMTSSFPQPPAVSVKRHRGIEAVAGVAALFDHGLSSRELKYYLRVLSRVSRQKIRLNCYFVGVVDRPDELDPLLDEACFIVFVLYPVDDEAPRKPQSVLAHETIDTAPFFCPELLATGMKAAKEINADQNHVLLRFRSFHSLGRPEIVHFQPTPAVLDYPSQSNSVKLMNAWTVANRAISPPDLSRFVLSPLLLAPLSSPLSLHFYPFLRGAAQSVSTLAPKQLVFAVLDQDVFMWKETWRSLPFMLGYGFDVTVTGLSDAQCRVVLAFFKEEWRKTSEVVSCTPRARLGKHTWRLYPHQYAGLALGIIFWPDSSSLFSILLAPAVLPMERLGLGAGIIEEEVYEGVVNGVWTRGLLGGGSVTGMRSYENIQHGVRSAMNFLVMRYAMKASGRSPIEFEGVNEDALPPSVLDIVIASTLEKAIVVVVETQENTPHYVVRNNGPRFHIVLSED